MPSIRLTVDSQKPAAVGNHFYLVTEMLSGEHLTAKQVLINDQLSCKVGVAIAGLQKGLNKVPNQQDFENKDFLEELNGWIKTNIDKSEKQYYAHEIFNDLLKGMNNNYPKLKRQLIHRDVHLDNMLFKDNELSGYIDFDISQINARVFDLAYMGIGILAEVNQDVRLKRMWFDFVDNLMKGYDSISPMENHERESVWLIMAAIEVLFVAYFVSKGNDMGAKTADDVLKWIWKKKPQLANL